MLRFAGRRLSPSSWRQATPAASFTLSPNPIACAAESSSADGPLARPALHVPLLGAVRGIAYGNLERSDFQNQQDGYPAVLCYTSVACMSSMANKDSSGPTEIVEELYQKMLKSIEARTSPPNAMMWSLISNCSNRADIEILFNMLQKLRIFRLSQLKIYSNFNSHLCMRVAEACSRANAFDYGLKALYKHNVYGLSPNIGSAHYLLSHAKELNDDKLMVEILRTLASSSLPLQPGTADLVFSICYNTNKWNLISKYSRRFIKAGVKLHRTAFDIWMEFAAKMGDSQSIWQIEKLRAKSVKQPTLACGFACAKGHLLEHNPETAAVTIHVLYEKLPDKQKLQFTDELQKLISQWRLDAIQSQKEEDKQALAESLKRDIPAMVNSLVNLGLDATVDLNELDKLEA